jgi:hypothetical protein
LIIATQTRSSGSAQILEPNGNSRLSRILREVIEHKLGIDPSFKLIKQKERRYIAKRRETIQQEVNRLLEAGFIRPVDYPSWLANPALVEKPDGS